MGTEAFDSQSKQVFKKMSFQLWLGYPVTAPVPGSAALQETKVFWDFRKGLIPIIGGSR